MLLWSPLKDTLPVFIYLMKKIFTVLFIAIFFSCAPIEEDKIIGNWFYSDGDKINFQFKFYKNSLVSIYANGSVNKLKWRIDADSIYTYYSDNPGPSYKYELDLNDKKLKLNNADLVLNLVKARNLDEFFFHKIIGLEIELPSCEHSLNRTEYLELYNPNYLYFPIYAGYSNDGLIVKTELSSDLNNIDKEVAEFKVNSRKEIINHLKFNLVADKNVSQYQLDSIKNKLMKTTLKQVYRAYKTELLDDMNDTLWISIKE